MLKAAEIHGGWETAAANQAPEAVELPVARRKWQGLNVKLEWGQKLDVRCLQYPPLPRGG